MTINAQSSTKRSSSNSSKTHLLKSTFSSKEWQEVSLSYCPTFVDSETLSGFTATYSRSYKLSKKYPIFLVPGIGLQYYYHSENIDLGDLDSDEREILEFCGPVKNKTNMWSLYIPVDVQYNYKLNENITIAPYAGLHVRFNISAKMKRSPSIDFRGGLDDSWDNDDMAYINEIFFGETNLLSSDDMGDYAWNRLQLGGHIGGRIYYKQNFVGKISVGCDFTELAKGSLMTHVEIGLGYKF